MSNSFHIRNYARCVLRSEVAERQQNIKQNGTSHARTKNI